MKIFIDIGHPAHVHYFRNFYHAMRNRGHEILITARDKECAHNLLCHYAMPFISRGTGNKSYLGKFFYLFKANYLLYKHALRFNPDLFLSFCSPYAAQVSSLLGKQHVAFDDTEHARMAHWAFVPFTDAICTPFAFNENLGRKQFYFNGFMELCALHPNRFEPDQSVLNQLGVEREEKYVLLRFVSWNASHDGGEVGIPNHQKEILVRALSKHATVFISSEEPLPNDLVSYKLDLPADKIHDALYYANLFVGEGATMAAESALLGSPTIYINSRNTGYISELHDAELLQSFQQYDGVQDLAEKILATAGIKVKSRIKAKRFIADKIDVTDFMIWFVENYPISKKELYTARKQQFHVKKRSPVAF